MRQIVALHNKYGIMALKIMLAAKVL